MGRVSMERLYTVKEVQEILKVGRSFAYKLVQSGEIRAVRVGRCLRVRATDLEKYLAAL
jgi:excisionase family DNA binding protein